MFDEARELIRAGLTAMAASMQLGREQHNDAMERSKIDEQMRREEMKAVDETRARSLALEERQTVAWERIASALERISGIKP